MPNVRYADYIASMDWTNRCVRFFGDYPMCAVRACRRRWHEGHVEVHHRTYERLGHERETDLVPLCSSCHDQAHYLAREIYARDGMPRDEALRSGTDAVLLAGGSRDLVDRLRAGDAWRPPADPRPPVSATDASTGIVYETADELWAEIQRRADEKYGPACLHGLRVRCRKCEHERTARERPNDWSDERSAITQPPQAAPADGVEPQEERDHAGEADRQEARPELSDIPF